MVLSLRLLITGLLLGALPGCCWDTCLATSQGAIVSFRLSADTLGGQGFSEREFRSCYVVEYADDRLTMPRDTLRFSPAARSLPGRLVVFEQRRFQLYFPGDSVRGQPSYYRIVVPAAGRRFEVRRVGLRWVKYQECRATCEEVRGISFALNGQPIDLPRASSNYAAMALELKR